MARHEPDERTATIAKWTRVAVITALARGGRVTAMSMRARLTALCFVALFAGGCLHDWSMVTRDAAADIPQDTESATTDAPCVPCEAGCADLASDPMNCGACGNVCSPPEGTIAGCTNGACEFHCPTGLTRCGSRCLDTTNNVSYCGETCFDCVTLPHVFSDTVTCTHGQCSLLNGCEPGWADCDGVVSTGCETDLSRPEHCGACTRACTAPSPNCAPVGTNTEYDCTP